jgi:hypothetical protein
MSIPKKSVSLNDINNYRLEHFQQKSDIMTIIIDNIRNYREIPAELLEKITFMTNEQKMTIIFEYNRTIGSIKYLLE